MQSAPNLKVLFIAGFGPVVRDGAESRRLYRDEAEGQAGFPVISFSFLAVVSSRS